MSNQELKKQQKKDLENIRKISHEVKNFKSIYEEIYSEEEVKYTVILSFIKKIKEENLQVEISDNTLQIINSEGEEVTEYIDKNGEIKKQFNPKNKQTLIDILKENSELPFEEGLYKIDFSNDIWKKNFSNITDLIREKISIGKQRSLYQKYLSTKNIGELQKESVLFIFDFLKIDIKDINGPEVMNILKKELDSPENKDILGQIQKLFDTNNINIKISSLYNDIQNLDFYKSMFNFQNLEEFLSVSENYGISKNITIPLSNLKYLLDLNKKENSEILNKQQIMFIKEQIVDIGKGFNELSVEETRKKINGMVKKTKKNNKNKIEILKRRLKNNENMSIEEKQYIELIIAYFDHINNMGIAKSDYLDEKVLFLVEGQNLEKYIERAFSGQFDFKEQQFLLEKLNKKFLYLNKSIIDNKIQILDKQTKNASEAKRFSAFFKMKSVFENIKSEELREEYKGQAAKYKFEYEKSGRNFIYKILVENNLIEYLYTDNKEAKDKLFQKLQDLNIKALHLGHIEEDKLLKQRKEEFFHIFDMIKDNEFLNQRNDEYSFIYYIKHKVNEANSEIPENIKESLNYILNGKQTATTIKRQLTQFLEKEDIEIIKVKEFLNKSLKKKNYQVIEKTEKQKDIFREYKVIQLLEGKNIDTVSENNRVNEITNLLFFKIAQSEKFDKLFKLISSKNSLKESNTFKIFKETLEKTYPDLFKKIENNKLNINLQDLVDNFHSIGFSHYKTEKIMERNDLNFLALHKAISEPIFSERYSEKMKILKTKIEEKNINIPKLIFDTLKETSPELLKQNAISHSEDLKKYVQYNYDFNHIRKKSYENRNDSNVEILTEKNREIRNMLNNEHFQNLFTSISFEYSLENNPVEIMYLIINNFNIKEDIGIPKQIIEEIQKDIIDKKIEMNEDTKKIIHKLQSDLEQSNVNDFYGFEKFLSSNNNFNIDFIAKKAIEKQALEEYNIIHNFVILFQEGNVKNILSNNEKEILFNAFEKLKKEPLNINDINIAYDKFENNISKSSNLLKRFSEYKLNYLPGGSLFLAKGRIQEIREILLSPKKNLQLDFEGIDIKKEEELEKLEIIEKELKSIDIFDTNNFEIKKSQIFSDLSQLQTLFKAKVYIQSLDKAISMGISSEEKPNAYLKTFAFSHNKTVEQVRDVFEQNIAKFEDLKGKIEKALSSEPFSEIEVLQSIQLLGLKNNEGMTYTNVLSHFIKSSDYEQVSFDLIFDPKNIQKMMNEDVKSLQFITAFEEIFNILKNNEGYNLKEQKKKIKKLLKNNFADDNIKDKLLELLENDLEQFREISYKIYTNTVDKNNFINKTRVYLQGYKNPKDTFDYISDIQENFSDSEIYSFLNEMKTNNIISGKELKEAFKAFNIDINIVPQINENLFDCELDKIDKLTEEEKINKNEQMFSIIGTEPSLSSELKWGTASNILFEKSYGDLSEGFLEFLNKVNPEITKALENEKIEDFYQPLKFAPKIDLSNSFILKEGFNLHNLLKLYFKEEILKNYPDNKFTDLEIERLLFLNQESTPFLATVINKGLFSMQDAFKAEYLKKGYEKDIENLRKDIKNLLTENSNNNMIQEERNEELKEKEKEFLEAKTQFEKIKNRIEELELYAKENGVEVPKEQMENLTKELNSVKNKMDSSKFEIDKIKNDISRQEDNKLEQQSLLISKKQQLDHLNTQSDNLTDPKFKNQTLAQKLYLNDETSGVSDEEVMNSTPEQMREYFKKDYEQNTIPLSLEERSRIIEKESKKEKDNLSWKESLKIQQKKWKRKLGIENPYRTLNSQMDIIGYSNFSWLNTGKGVLRGVNSLSTVLGVKALGKLALKDMAKSLWIGHSKNAASGMGRLLGVDLTTNIPSFKEAGLAVFNAISAKKMRERRKKEKSEAPEKIKKALEEILKEIKNSSNPSVAFAKALKNGLIKDIMNPKKQKSLGLLNIDNSVFVNFRESMYLTLQSSMMYNIDVKNQKKAFFSLLETMQISKETAITISQGNFQNLKNKGISSKDGEEYEKLIKIMKFGKEWKEKDINNPDGKALGSFPMFQKYLRDYAGYTAEKDKKTENINLYSKTIKLEEELFQIRKQVNFDSPTYSLILESFNSLSDSINKYEGEDLRFKNPNKASSKIYQELSKNIGNIISLLSEEMKRLYEDGVPKLLEKKNNGDTLSPDEELKLNKYLNLEKELHLLKNFSNKIEEYRQNIIQYRQTSKNAEDLLNEINEKKNIEDKISVKEDILKENKEEITNDEMEIISLLTDLKHSYTYNEEDEKSNKKVNFFLKKYQQKYPNEAKELEMFLSRFKGLDKENISKILKNEYSLLKNNLNHFQKYFENEFPEDVKNETNNIYKKLGKFEKYGELVAETKELETEIGYLKTELSQVLLEVDLEQVHIKSVYRMYSDESFKKELLNRLNKGEKLEDIEKDYIKTVETKRILKKEDIINLFGANIEQVNEKNISKFLDILKVDLKTLSEDNNRNIEKENLIEVLKDIYKKSDLLPEKYREEFKKSISFIINNPENLKSSSQKLFTFIDKINNEPDFIKESSKNSSFLIKKPSKTLTLIESKAKEIKKIPKKVKEFTDSTLTGPAKRIFEKFYDIPNEIPSKEDIKELLTGPVREALEKRKLRKENLPKDIKTRRTKF